MHNLVFTPPYHHRLYSGQYAELRQQQIRQILGSPSRPYGLNPANSSPANN